MPKSPPKPPSASLAPPPPCSQLLTEVQVITRLKQEIASKSLTEVAKLYKIKPQQLSDISYGRASLSKKVLSKIQLRMHRFYERIG